MRISKLLGLLFFVAGFFTFTRGTGWHFGYMLGGALLGFVGMLLVSRRRVRRIAFNPPYGGRKSVLPRSSRVDLSGLTR